jgi:hypothetical protein
MTCKAPLDSLAILASRGTFELARGRLITAHDASRAAMLAIRPARACEIAVVRMAWEVGGMAADSPIGKFGSRVSATVELHAGWAAQLRDDDERSLLSVGYLCPSGAANRLQQCRLDRSVAVE